MLYWIGMRGASGSWAGAGSARCERGSALVAVFLAAGLCCAAPARAGDAKEKPSWFRLGISQIAVLEIDDVIYDSRHLTGQIRRFERNPLVKALVLRIDSPGGEVAPVQEIVRELARFRRGGSRPIVASFAGVAASGGYYIACGADRIVSNPGALTGSIGVVMEFPNAADLFKKVGVRYVVVKSGRFKDSGSFSREITPEELAVLQGTIDDVYEQFLEAVWAGRREGLRRAVARSRGSDDASSVSDQAAMRLLREVADGRVLSGRQAFEAGLVDELGGLEEAIDAAVELSGVRGRNVVTAKRRRREPRWTDLLGAILRLGLPDAVLPPAKRVSLQYLLR